MTSNISEQELSRRLLELAKLIQPDVTLSNDKLVFSSKGATIRRDATPRTVRISRSVRSR